MDGAGRAGTRAAARQPDDWGRRAGGTAGLPAGVPLGRDYDIFAGAVSLPMPRWISGSCARLWGLSMAPAMGTRATTSCTAFRAQPEGESTQLTTGIWPISIRVRRPVGRRDYSCPARLRGVRTDPAPANNPYAIGADSVAAAREGYAAVPLRSVYHSVSNLFNGHLGNNSHVGIDVTYSNPGTLVIPVGAAGVPGEGARDHRLVHVSGHGELQPARDGVCAGNPGGGDSRHSQDPVPRSRGLLEWTLNPHFDIRLTGNIADCRLMATKTWRIGRLRPQCGGPPVLSRGRHRRCGGKPASGRASSDLSPSSYRESGSPDSLALLCTVCTRRPQVGQKSVHFGLFYAMKTPG